MLDLRQLSARVQRRRRDPLPEQLWKFLPPFRSPPRGAAAAAARVLERGEEIPASGRVLPDSGRWSAGARINGGRYARGSGLPDRRG
jgi:hypothetical protein